ncbi:crotonase/enoyl-CoA hydratase family protein [Lysobacter enzymogenes]|uniref:crotonase/enoyl-CoA hydratase family protein n=1 Tax=Lysobacter enzymogenes TaxID=69 RepID=UPI00099C6DE0|nr:crotonase/enoyl-CoA hydratase family protein [Lysobacter enzymogenes]QQP99221.1 crotonase/enoyl-CoA hydratase family protein [Lysobacter enzymogenes]UZW58668.1 crotonase/enoyl-CoA hydratase family protein [Lysobacter enzymogenes]
MSTIEKLHRVRAYPTLRIESAPDGLAHWLYMHEDVGLGVRPCFRTPLMEDMWAFLSSISLREGQAPSELRHVVLASSAPAFNLGGDLELFSRLIRSQDRERLLSYARRCVDGVHHIHGGLGGDVHTIALVQGDALGGGLELALSCHTIVAEEGVDMGLPEVVFDLFPGMGAYSYLCKRVSPRVAEKLIMDGALLSSEEMHRLGVVDVLVPRGQGEAAVADLIRRQQRSPHSQLAMNKMRQIAQPTSYQELMAITELWVDTALALPDKALRTMDRIVRAQERRAVAA